MTSQARAVARSNQGFCASNNSFVFDRCRTELTRRFLGKQLLRCGTSVAANYRAACRARSKAEFIARIGNRG